MQKLQAVWRFVIDQKLGNLQSSTEFWNETKSALTFGKILRFLLS